MKKAYMMFLVVLVLFTMGATRDKGKPLTLVQTFKLPAEIKSRFDHFGIDLKGHRLFATPEDYHALLVLDYRTGKILQTVRGIEKPHAVVYPDDMDRVYVTDAEAGVVRIIYGKPDKSLEGVPLH